MTPSPPPNACRPAAAACLVLLTSLGLPAGAASAQVVSTLDVGSHTVDLRGAPAASGAAVAPALGVSVPFGRLDASALRLIGATGPARDLWTGALGATLTTSRGRALRGELGGALRRDVGPEFAAVSAAQAESRLRYERSAFGFWTSQTTGRATGGGGGRNFGGLGAGFWKRLGSLTFTTSLSWMRTRDSVQMRVLFDTTVTSWIDSVLYRDSVFRVGDSTWTQKVAVGTHRTEIPKDTSMTRLFWGLDALAYTDVESGVQWGFRGVELGARAGTRVGLASRRGGQWASATGSVRVSRRAAVVLLAGREPEDIARGLPARRLATVGMRLSRTPLLGYGGREPTPVAGGSAAGALRSAFEVAADAAPGSYTVQVRAPGAREVEIMASFTAWEAVALRPAGGGAWTVTLPIPPGVHQVNLRVDRGAWRAPPGLTTVVDGFNGTVGLLVIE